MDYFINIAQKEIDIIELEEKKEPKYIYSILYFILDVKKYKNSFNNVIMVVYV